MSDNIIGDNIKSARIEAGLTQKGLAEKMGVPYRSVQRWEKGVYKPSMDNLLKLSTVLEKTIEELALSNKARGEEEE